MIHWKSAHIQNFRRLKDVRLEKLGAVNLLVGKNNSGKTSILEALAITANPLHPGTWIDVAWKREIKSSRTPVAEVIKWVFPNANSFEEPGTFYSEVNVVSELPDNSQWILKAKAQESIWYDEDTSSSTDDIELDESGSTSFSGGESIGFPVLEITITNWKKDDQGNEEDHEQVSFNLIPRYPIRVEPQPSRPGWPFQFITPVSHRTENEQITNLSKALDQRRRGEIIELLKSFMPHVDSIEIISIDPRNPRVRIQGNGNSSQPLSVQGDGLRRALVLATSVSFASNGFLFIDEIETAFHPDVLKSVMRFLINACEQFNVQIFATTHSLEALDAIMAGIDDDVDRISVYHLPPQGSELGVYRLGGKSVKEMRQEGGFDLR